MHSRAEVVWSLALDAEVLGHPLLGRTKWVSSGQDRGGAQEQVVPRIMFSRFSSFFLPSPGECSEDEEDVLQRQGVQEAHPPQSDAVQEGQGLPGRARWAHPGTTVKTCIHSHLVYQKSGNCKLYTVQVGPGLPCRALLVVAFFCPGQVTCTLFLASTRVPRRSAYRVDLEAPSVALKARTAFWYWRVSAFFA